MQPTPIKQGLWCAEKKLLPLDQSKMESPEMVIETPAEDPELNEFVDGEVIVGLKRDIQVLLLKKVKDVSCKEIYCRTLKFLLGCQVTIFLEENCYMETIAEIPEWVTEGKMKVLSEIDKERLDFMILLGGDGTILWASSLFPEIPIPPALTVKLGTFNFLSIFPAEYLMGQISIVLQSISQQKKLSIDSRIRLRAEIVTKEGRQVFSALNEILVDRGSFVQTVSMNLDINGHPLTTVTGSGLIISTPTGSTAYSLSAGGPILHPKLPAMLITPLCPTQYTLKPMAIPASFTLTITRGDSRVNPIISIDGQKSIEFPSDGQLIITKSDFDMPIIMDGNPALPNWISKLHTIFPVNKNIKGTPRL